MWWSWRFRRELQAGTVQRQPSRAKTGSWWRGVLSQWVMTWREQAFERRPARLFRIREGIEHVAQQRDDGCRAGEADLGVRRPRAPFVARPAAGRRGALLVRTDLQSRVR